MVDIHTHILPSVDDGSQSIEESLEMLQISLSCGVSSVVLTPHANQSGRFENYLDKNLTRRFLEFKKRVEQEELPIRLFYGMEIFSSHDIQDLILCNMLMGLNGSRYFLVEFPFEADIPYIGNCLNDIIHAKGIPIIAHPERYFCFQDDPSVLYSWIQKGIRTQINSGSVFGQFGPHAQKTSELLFKNDLVTCIGSDAHGTRRRNTDLSRLKSFLVKKYGANYTKKVMRENSLKMLRNQFVDAHGKPLW